MIFFSWVLVNTLLIAGLFFLTYAFYELLRPVSTAGSFTGNPPFVSILVPARNEEDKIGRLLASLLAQDYPNFEIVVIDDRSTDNTAQIIQSFVDGDKNKRIKFVHGKDAPDGWIGKCNALAHAATYASGDWLVFIDADTYHKPNSIRDAIYCATNEKVDFISFLPMQELGSLPEKLIMPLLLGLFLIGDPFHQVNDPKCTRAYAYGQYIICRRKPYLEIGGHHRVCDEIVEDHALARVFKERGYKIQVSDGRTLYSVRMYTDLASLWQGWTKNLYWFIESRVINLIFLLFLINSVALLPFIQLGIVVHRIFNGMDYNSPLGLTLIASVVAQIFLLALWFKTTSRHHEGMSWYNFFLFPFGSIAVSILYLHSAYVVLSGSQVSWKGRRYVVNNHNTIRPGYKPSLETAYNSSFTGTLDISPVHEVREVSTIL